MTPVIGYISNLNIEKLKPSSEEVEEVFTVPLSHLFNNENSGHKQIISPQSNHTSIRTKYYKIPSHNCEIWGLTAYLTDVILNELRKCFSNTEEKMFIKS